MSKLVFIAGNARSLIANRGDLIMQLKGLGHEINALVPAYDFLPELDGLGIPYELIDLSRPSMNPCYDLRSCSELIRRIRRLAPDIVFSYTIKPVIYGSIAARFVKVPRITSMITGLGFLFTGNSLKQRAGRFMAQTLYRIAMPLNDVIFFQNPDDRELFQRCGLVRRDQKAVLVNGSGVNLDHFSPAPLPKGPVRFLLIARLLQDKGIAEYVEAAERVRAECPEAYFEVVGPHDPSLPRSIRVDQIEVWRASGHVTFHPGVKDVRPHLASCSVYVLPSYREGTPRTVLEAMAMGRPVITTDAPGCRETVAPGLNGFLVPLGNVNELANAMRRFTNNPELIPRMGSESRSIAEEKYDVRKVNSTIISHLLGTLSHST